MIHKIEAQVDSLVARVAAIPQLDRLVGAAIGLPSLAVILIGAWLEPSPAGYGTHVQLGLGGCTMMILTGWPCPMCGMTTTFSLMSHFRVLDALVNQPFGVVLYSITVAMAVIGLVDLVAGRGLWRRAVAAVGRMETIWAFGLLIGMGLGWVYKAVRVHPEVLAWIGLDGLG